MKKVIKNIGGFVANNRRATVAIIGIQPSEVARLNIEFVKQANAFGLDNDQKIPEVLAIGINCHEKKYLIEMAEVCVGFGCDFVVSPDKLGESRLDQIIRDNVGVSVIFQEADKSNAEFAKDVLKRAMNTRNVRRPNLRFSEESEDAVKHNLNIDRISRGQRIENRIKNFGQYSVFKNNPFIGVIGGAGPWASADLCRAFSQHAVNFCHFSVNSAPGKHAFEMGTGPSYIQHYSNAVDFFSKIGTKFLAIPCNTAHMRLADFTGKEISKVIDIRKAVLTQNKSVDGFILLGTNRTVGIDLPEDQTEGIYEQWCKKNGRHNSFYVPTVEQQKIVMEAIFDVKAGRVDEAKKKINQTVSEIRESYNNPTLPVILGCTELPLVFEKSELVAHNYIDPAESLAKSAQKLLNKVSLRNIRVSKQENISVAKDNHDQRSDHKEKLIPEPSVRTRANQCNKLDQKVEQSKLHE